MSYVGVPVWWLTTQIQRPALPHARMQQASAAIHLPLHLTLYLQQTQLDTDVAIVAEHFLAALVKDTQDDKNDLTLHVIARSQSSTHCVGEWLQLSEATDPADGSRLTEGKSTALCQSPEFESLLASHEALSPTELDDAWNMLLQQHDLSRPGSYQLVATSTTASNQQQPPFKLLIGQGRGAFLTVPGDEHGGRSQLEQLLQALTAASPIIARAFMSSAGSITAGQQPLSAAGEALLSFSLCNADPAEQYSTWKDFTAFQRQYLDPVIAALRPAVRLSVESHVLLYTSSSQTGAWSDAHAAFVIKQSKLRHFVDSHWNLNTGAMAAAAAAEASNGTAGKHAPQLVHSAESMIPKHVLHFVAYVPARAQQPLLLLLPEEQPSPTNSFHMPSWGGVHVINPRSSSSHPAADGRKPCQAQVPGLCSAHAAARALSDDEMRQFARVVVSQLRALLGVDLRDSLLRWHASAPGALLELQALPALRTGVCLWEADVLLRQRAEHNAATAAQVLRSLSRLVEQLPSLEMPDVIGDEVEEALRSLDRAAAAMHAGDHTAVCIDAQAARSYAEAAFSNPSVLAQLSFPPSHLIGVYLPFFAPLGMALVQALFTELQKKFKKRPGAL